MEIIELASLATAILSIYIVKKTTNPINFFNPFVYFYWIYFIFSFVALFYRDIYTYAITVSFETILFINCGLIFYSLGGYISFLISKNKKACLCSIENQIKILCFNKSSLFIVLASFFIPLIFSFYFIHSTDEILWLSDSFDDYRISLREGTGWIATVGTSSAYYATIYASTYFTKNKSTLALCLSTTILAMSAVVYGNRAPAFEVIVIGGVFICYHIFKRVSIIHVISGFVLIMIALMTLGIIRQGLDFDVESLFKQILWRPFTNIQNIEWITNYFPSIHDFFYGESFLIDLSVLLPGYQPNFGTYIKELMGLYFSGGSLTLSFLGQAYIDFGYIFSIFLIFLFGFSLHYMYQRYVFNPNFGFLLIITSVYAKSTVSSGIISPFLYTFIPTTFFLVFFHVISTIIFNKHKY